MKSEFSEFSYGFALSFEIMNGLGSAISGTPLFPSLFEEAQKGYDVDFTLAGWPLFLQFKLADYLSIGNSKQYSFYGSPYFRFSIRPINKSKQHNLLKDLSKEEPEVYYVAPSFYKLVSLNDLFKSVSIFMQSVFVPLTDLPSIHGNEQHCVTFRSSSGPWKWHSDNSFDLRGVYSGEEWLIHIKERMSQPRNLDIRYFKKLRSILIRIIEKNEVQLSLFENFRQFDDGDPYSVIRDVRYLLAVFFGVEPLILYQVNNNGSNNSL
jgi:hypothetical protein